MKKKLFALLLTGAIALGLAACGSSGNNTSSPSGSTAPAGTDGKTYVVGISQLVTHPALDAATEGFQAALNDLLPGQVEIDLQNAANDPATCSTIATSFVSQGVDLIMANATPALQAAAAPSGGADIMEVNTEKSMELRKTVRQFAQNNPEIAAQMVKAWLRGGEDNG